MKVNRDIELLFEIGQLRLIDRMWRRFFQSDIANVADHTFRVVWIALSLAKREKVKNEEKIIKMALMHDIPESRTGDVDYISRQYTEKKDDLAMKDILKGTSLEKEFLDLWKEYQERKTIESKIVKDADTLDVDLELKEQIAQTTTKKWIKERKVSVKSQLYTKTAKTYQDAIYTSNDYDWHLNGRNRYNKGDWKRKK